VDTTLVLADIPGLIEGAHEGAGLGYEFLRHIERTKVLLHLVDVTAADPIADYETIQQELVAYGRGLSDRPQIVALNKLDATDLDGDALDAIAAELEARTHGPIFRISAVTRVGLDPLLQEIWRTLDDLSARDVAVEMPVFNP
jgi:GTP-binding protein